MSTAYTYAANDQAKALGSPQIQFVKTGTNAGGFNVTMPDGEMLVGRYSVIQGGMTGFGSLYGSLYGRAGAASVGAFSSSAMFSNSSPAVADAQGPRTTMHCEVMNSIGGHGNGACETDKGARFRVQY